MTKGEVIRMEIDRLGGDIGILIEASNGVLHCDETVPVAIKSLLSEIHLPNEHKVSILKMVIKEYE